MRIDKSFSIDAPQDEVWKFVSSPEKVGMCFPGCQGITSLGEDKYKAEIKVQMGPIKTLFNVDFEETEKRPMEYLSYTTRGEEGNRSSRLKADSTLEFSAINARRTKVVYSSDLSIVGRLGKFGLGMMKKKADSMGDEFVQVLPTQIEGHKEPAEGELAKADRFGSGQKIFAVALTAIIIYLVYFFLTR